MGKPSVLAEETEGANQHGIDELPSSRAAAFGPSIPGAAGPSSGAYGSEGRLRGARAFSGEFRIPGARAASDHDDSAGNEAPAFRARIPSTPEHDAANWTDCAAQYQRFAAAVTRPFCRDAARLIRMYPRDRVLDVATGTGEFAVAAAERGGRVLATDFSPSMLELLERECLARGLGAIDTAVMDGQQLDLEDEVFDAAGSIFGLVFFPDPQRGLDEIHRVLKPQRQAVIATWAPPGRVELMRLVGEALMQVGVAPEGGAPQWSDLCNARRIGSLLKDAGFSSVHVVEVAHVWTFEDAEDFSLALTRMTPSWSELARTMNADQHAAFSEALCHSFKLRQGDGPFAVTVQGLLAVGTKPARTQCTSSD